MPINDFKVVCDESNNPPESIAEGRLNVTISMPTPQWLADDVNEVLRYIAQCPHVSPHVKMVEDGMQMDMGGATASWASSLRSTAPSRHGGMSRRFRSAMRTRAREWPPCDETDMSTVWETIRRVVFDISEDAFIDQIVAQICKEEDELLLNDARKIIDKQ